MTLSLRLRYARGLAARPGNHRVVFAAVFKQSGLATSTYRTNVSDFFLWIFIKIPCDTVFAFSATTPAPCTACVIYINGRITNTIQLEVHEHSAIDQLQLESPDPNHPTVSDHKCFDRVNHLNCL
jgi:hypothetical protein